MNVRIVCGCIAFLLFSSSLLAKTICFEPSDDTNNFHMVWQGKMASEKARTNVEILCRQAKDYVKTVDEKFKVMVWTDDNSLDVLRALKDCNSSSQNADSLGSFSYEVRNLEGLINAEPEHQTALYRYLLAKNNFAGASDYTRLLAVRKYGGCYMDMGFRIVRQDFISSELQNTYDSNKTYFTAIGGGHDTENSDLELPGKTHQKIFELYSGMKTNVGATSRENARMRPSMRFFNSFFAARKNHPIINAIYDEFVFKNNFFSTYQMLIDGIYENCSSHPVVMSLMGQFAYNDVYLSFATARQDLLQQIKVLDLNDHIPYAGSNSWRTDNQKSCGLFVASVFDRYEDKRLDAYKESRDDNFGLKLVFGNKDPGIIARKLLLPLLRLFRSEPTSPITSLSSITSEDMAALTRGINNARSLAMNTAYSDILNICSASKDFVDDGKPHEYQRKEPSSSKPVIIRAGVVAEKSLSLNSSYYVDDEKFDPSSPDDLYYGIFVHCQEKVKDIFLPQVKIRPGLAAMFSSIPKPVATLESAYRRIDSQEIYFLKNKGELDMRGVDISEDELLLLSKTHEIRKLQMSSNFSASEAVLGQLLSLQELLLYGPVKISAGGILSLLDAQNQRGLPLLKLLRIQKGRFNQSDLQKIEGKGVSVFLGES